MIFKTHLHWFNLKCPSPKNSKEYAAAKRRLEGAIYSDLEKLRAELDEFDDGSIPVIVFRKGNHWLCSIGSPPEAQNLKGIQPHGRRFRVQNALVAISESGHSTIYMRRSKSVMLSLHNLLQNGT